VGIAQRTLGLVLRGEQGVELLREAVDTLDASPSILERNSARLSLGSTLRRAGRLTESREWLAQALDLAHRFGARLMERQARQELKLAGARPRRYELSGVGSLTPAELRVATMAAAGRSNREVAQACSSRPRPSSTTSATCIASWASVRGVSSRAPWRRLMSLIHPLVGSLNAYDAMQSLG
jgi:hypothetical protein